jgi:hypothetical protein
MSDKKKEVETENKDKFIQNLNNLQSDDEYDDEENEQQEYEDELQKKMDLEAEIQRNLIDYVSSNYKPLCEYLTIENVEKMMSLFS